MEKNWHNFSWQEAVEELSSRADSGLSEEEVLARQKKSGKNLLPQEKSLSQIRVFFSQLKSPLIYILIMAGLITLFFQEWADAAIIFGAVFLNTTVGFLQENKASRALRELKKIIQIKAEVIRGQKQLLVDSGELVAGDIIMLSAGNKVPADGRLIEANNLKINEAPLTGEWLSSSKRSEIVPSDTPMADRDNMVYTGSMVEEGRGKAVVTEIGAKTETGKIAALLKETKEEKTPLQKKLSSFSRLIGIVIALLSVFIFTAGILTGKDFLEMFMTSVAVAVAAIPEGLPIALTVILALGMQRILKRKGLVRKLVSAETLGSTSIIATDKTLTLTEGKMRADQIFSKDKELFFKVIALTNEAFVENPDDPLAQWIVRGRPTDKALLLAGAQAGFKKWQLEKEYFRIQEIPFNSQSKFRAALYREDGGQATLFVSGAPEIILGFSKLEQPEFLELNKILEDFTGQGLRVVAAAYKEIRNSKFEIRNLENEINNLTFVGFIGLKDSLRPEAKEAFDVCRKAGIRSIIVTGDHLLTAKAIARELGLEVSQENTIEGKDLDKMSDQDLQEKVKNIDIYARVEPRHKLRIIEAWQKKGEVVAMTGDGVNDAPALKKADIGVALGSGTDVAKEVSDLVLLTDNFNIMVAAVEEGRVIIDNIRKVITYLLSDSFTETILIGVSIILGWPLPVTAAQILWVNIIEDGLPSIALAFEAKEKEVLQRKPEGKVVQLLTQQMKVIIFIIGFLTDLIILGLLWWLLQGSYSLEHLRTMIFVALGIDSLFYVFSCKNLRKNIWKINPFSNKFLLVSCLFGFSVLIGAVYLSPLQKLLKTVPLGLFDWSLLLSLGVLNILLIEVAKYYFINNHKTEK